MATNVSIDGVTYSIPAPRDRNYAAGATGLTEFFKKIATAFSVRPQTRYYQTGIAYPNGTPTITDGSIARISKTGFLAVSQTADGQWILDVNVYIQSSGYEQYSNFDISGITSLPPNEWPLAANAFSDSFGDFVDSPTAYLYPGTGSFNTRQNDPTQTYNFISIFGRVFLQSKPTWAT